MNRLTSLSRWISIVVVAGCRPTTGQSWPPATAIDVRQPGAFRAPPVMESSGVTMSQRFPGLLWTLNDSENPATLFLADTTGKIRGFVRLGNAVNVDWEALSSGPCGDRHCLYVGDIGDNLSRRSSVTVYRVVEPTRADLDRGWVDAIDSLAIQYPAGPNDSESLLVTQASDLAMVTKGRDGRAAAFWVDGAAWTHGRAVAEPIGTLPIATSLIMSALITDAALSPDEQTMAVRTYEDIYLFQRTPTSTKLPDRPAAHCSIGRLDPQGEGLAWVDNTTLVLTSEIARSRPGVITLLRCPVP